MPGGKLAGVNIGLHRFRQFQQPQRVGDIAAALADDLRNLVLAVAEFVHQRAIAFRLFERIEIGALDVLDDRELQRLGVGRFDDDDGHFVQAGALRRAPAAFAGDDLVSVDGAADRARDDRLDDAALAQRSDKFVELGIGESAPRIAAIRPQRTGRHPPLAARSLDRELSAPTSPINAARPRPSRDRVASSAIAAFSQILSHLRIWPHPAHSVFLSLDDFGGEPQIGFAAAAFEIVDQHRLAVGRRFRDPHVARDDGVVDFRSHEFAHVGDHLARQIVARIEHRQHDAVDREIRVELFAHLTRPS